MGEIRLTHQLNAHSQLARDLVAQGANRVREGMEGVEAEVVAEVKNIIREEFNNSRTGHLSKGEGHLLDSIKARVVGQRDQFPIVIEVWSTQDDAKVGALEFGARDHFIFAEESDFLYFPSNRLARKGRRRGGGSILGLSSQVGTTPFLPKGTGSRGGKSKQVAKLPHVHHPGNRPFHFLRRGLDKAVERRLGR